MLTAFSVFGASAQRQAVGRSAVMAGFTDGIGGGVRLDKFYIEGSQVTGLQYLHRPFMVSEDGTDDYEVDAHEFTLEMGFIRRLLSTRSRSVVFSAGTCLDLGASYALSLPMGGGVYDDHYGILVEAVPEADLEIFPFRNVSLVASAKARLYLFDSMKRAAAEGSQAAAGGVAIHRPWYGFNYGLGIRLYW